jgi:hypothetical protein
MTIVWGELWHKSRRSLKTGWLITAGIVAVYVGFVQPYENQKSFESETHTGLGAVATDPILPWDSVPRDGINQSAAYDRGGAPASPRFEAKLSSVKSFVAQQTDDRKVFQSGDLELMVKNPAENVDKIRQIAEDAGGFLVASETQGNGNYQNASISIRVPTAALQDVLAAIRKLGIKVQRESISAQDVTRQYVDDAARLNNLKAQETQYLAILKRATNIKDIVEVSEKLDDVRNSIEQEQAEFETLSKQVETVAITVTMRPEADMNVLGLNWRPLYQLKLALRNGLDGIAGYATAMASLLFYLPSILLWLATVLFGAALGWRILRWSARILFSFPKQTAERVG